MYTLNGAFSLRQDTKVGSLEVGKEADLIVIANDIFEQEKAKDYYGIANTIVLQTLVAGEEIYRNSQVMGNWK